MRVPLSLGSVGGVLGLHGRAVVAVLQRAVVVEPVGQSAVARARASMPCHGRRGLTCSVLVELILRQCACGNVTTTAVTYAPMPCRSRLHRGRSRRSTADSRARSEVAPSKG